jgi:hypothetical protein
LYTEISNAFFDEGVRSDEFKALHLSEIGLLSGHIDEEQLGNIARSQGLLVFLNQLGVTAKLSRIAAISFWYSARSSA